MAVASDCGTSDCMCLNQLASVDDIRYYFPWTRNLDDSLFGSLP